MRAVGRIWKSSGRLADGREIIYFDESPGLGRAEVRDSRELAAVPSGWGLPESGLRWDPLAGEWGHEAFAAHLQVLSVRRAPGKLKYLAGSESGMGVWINDIMPETAAQRLREAP